MRVAAVVLIERSGATVQAFVQALEPISGFRPRVLISGLVPDPELPPGCIPVELRDEALRRYGQLWGRS